MFISPKTCGTRAPPMSIVAANAHGPARAAKNDPSVSIATANSAFFTNHAADLGVQKVWKISRGQQVFAGVAANLALNTSPGSAARNEYSATLGYSARLTERVTASASSPRKPGTL